jgi:hypothetical protein
MKQALYLVVLTLLVATGCKQKANDNGAGVDNTAAREETLAGDVQKEWKAQREEDATGDKERLDRTERRERVIFYRNHNVTMTSDETSRQGKWTLDANRLGIQFEGTDVVENFDVLELDKNTLRLRAGDGSEMKLKPE